MNGGFFMTKGMKGEILYRLRNIAEISLFLVVATWFWYGPRVEIEKKNEVISKSYAYMSGTHIQNQGKILLSQNQLEGEFQFTIENNAENVKKVLVTIVDDYDEIGQDHCNKIANNKVHYYLMRKDKTNHLDRTLSLSGNILLTTLQPKEKRTYVMKYFVNKENITKDEHFHGKVILENGENL